MTARELHEKLSKKLNALNMRLRSLGKPAFTPSPASGAGAKRINTQCLEIDAVMASLNVPATVTAPAMKPASTSPDIAATIARANAQLVQMGHAPSQKPTRPSLAEARLAQSRLFRCGIYEGAALIEEWQAKYGINLKDVSREYADQPAGT